MPLLEVIDLSIEFHSRAGIAPAVSDINFVVEEGQTLGIVGESGSGKSVTCYSLLGLLPKPQAHIVSGVAWFRGEEAEPVDLLDYRHKQGKGDNNKEFLQTQQVAMIFQDPSVCLNPYLTIGEQLIEPLLYQQPQVANRSEATKRALSLLDEVGIRDPHLVFKSWPHQLSGGMNQRVMIAMALMPEPKLLIADEPTTALDVTIQAQILELLKNVQKRHNLSIIFISHDLSVVSTLVDHILIMNKGLIVEQGSPEVIFKHTQDEYTKALIAAIPKGSKQQEAVKQDEEKPLLKVDNLVTEFQRKSGTLTAVNNVSLEILKGQVLGLVGESGSGKSTLGRSILKLVESQSGQLWFQGQNFQGFSKREMKPLRRQLQMIFQDPYASLNPRMTLYETLEEPLLLHGLADSSRVQDSIVKLLEDVGLSPKLQYKYPHEFSGGQRQRIAIGRALACRPQLIVADEPVSALDVTIQAQIIELLLELVSRYQLALLFISHDLSVVRTICDQVLVMRQGVLVERGDTETLFNNPQHEYTQQLLGAIPDSPYIS